MKHVALLRGINVGGKAILPMKELVAIFEACGASEVKTYIQSGNVVFFSDSAEEVVGRVTGEVARVYGYSGRVVLRSGVEMEAVLRGNPFLGAAVATLHVYFLADRPSAAAVKGLDAQRSAGDSFVVIGREVYLQLPNGMARTKLTNSYFDSRLGTVSTARNWNTVGKLVELLGLGWPPRTLWAKS